MGSLCFGLSAKPANETKESKPLVRSPSKKHVPFTEQKVAAEPMTMQEIIARLPRNVHYMAYFSLPGVIDIDCNFQRVAHLHGIDPNHSQIRWIDYQMPRHVETID
jgi:hypothetical protein